MDRDIETLKKKYKLSPKEHNQIQARINSIMTYDKYPVKNPKAIINIAPPASGKTGLNVYGGEQFIDNNVVIINSDELKPFHPKIEEIAKLYPDCYTKITDQESNTWTSTLFNFVLEKGYNVIFEGTGRNTKILDTIKNNMKNHNVMIRAMAVNELNCLISILERYEYQIEKKGWGRLVTLSHFYETYNEMPNTIDSIEKSNLVDTIEVYKRGNIPYEPIKIYDNIDKKYGRFPNAKYAILGGRVEDEEISNSYFEKEINTIISLLNNGKATEEEKNILMRLIEIHEEYVKKNQNINLKEK